MITESLAGIMAAPWRTSWLAGRREEPAALAEALQ
jgi:hypothetical protein